MVGGVYVGGGTCVHVCVYVEVCVCVLHLVHVCLPLPSQGQKGWWNMKGVGRGGGT